MLTLLRHLLSILLLPFMVVVVVPWWLLGTAAGSARWGGAPVVEWLSRAAGAVAFAGGFALFAWCVSLFARVGQGTLAPWDPTEKLVAVGPYGHVRNPMISGVLLMLVGKRCCGDRWRWRSGPAPSSSSTTVSASTARTSRAGSPG